MDYGAISIDTSIFDQKGLKLESGILKTLEQFNGMPSHLVLSEIVVREVHNHVKKKATESRALAIKAIRESVTNLSVSKEKSELATQSLIPEEDDNEVAKNRILSFLQNTGAEVIAASERVELDVVIKRYFQSEPPFAESGKKKNEFPDAIALISLEEWAKENRTKVLAVAKDGDWKNFAAQSDHIDVIEDLAEAISKFQPHSSAIDFCSHLSRELPKEESSTLFEHITDHLNDAVSEMEVYSEASSQFYFEPDIVEVIFDDFDFIKDDEGNVLLQPIQGQAETIIIESKVYIKATANTSFSLEVRDPIDKDYVPIGSSSASTEIEFESEILLTFEGDFDGDIEDIELTNFELLSYPNDVDFGEIEPDWWHEHE